MEKSVIADIYNEGVSQAETIRPQGETYKLTCVLKEKKEAMLLESFSAEQKELFEAFLHANADVEGFYNEESFRQGVAFGVQITAEAFLCRD